MPADVADLHPEMNAAFNSGLVRAHGTGPRSSTTIAEWAAALGLAGTGGPGSPEGAGPSGAAAGIGRSA